MKRFLLLLLLTTLLPTGPAVAKTLTKVAAVVNTDIISTYQLDKAVLEALEQNSKGNQLTSKQFDELKAKILENLINEKLVEQRIKEMGLKVSDQELNAAIEDVQVKNGLTAEQLENAVKAQGMTLEAYRDQLRQEILRFKLFGREVNYKVQVTSGEIRDYFREHINEYRAKPKVRVSSISYDISADLSENKRAELRKQVEVTRELLISGEEFDKVLESQGDSAFGGDMGDLVEEDLTAELRQALAGLEVGDVSQPVEMNNQLHLFMITARNPGDVNLFDRVKEEIEKIIKKEKTDLRFKEWAQELRDRGHVDIRI